MLCYGFSSLGVAYSAKVSPNPGPLLRLVDPMLLPTSFPMLWIKCRFLHHSRRNRVRHAPYSIPNSQASRSIADM
jgi:hypothetical protein